MLDFDDLITLREAADQLGVTYDEVWRLTRGDALESYRCSGQWLVSRRQVTEYVRNRPRTPGQVSA